MSDRSRTPADTAREAAALQAEWITMVVDLFEQVGELQGRVGELERQYDAVVNGPQLLTRVEAAEYLRVHPRTLHNYVTEGYITRYGPSHKPLFRKDDLNAFIERGDSNGR